MAKAGIGKLPFRMPLHPKDRQACMGNTFRDAIIGALYDMQFPPKLADGLMVGAVGNHLTAIEPGEKRAGLYRSGMDFVMPIPGMPGGFRNML